MKQYKFNYYKSELANLVDSETNKNVKISDSICGATKILDLNVESIEVLIGWLKLEQKRLKKLVK